MTLIYAPLATPMKGRLLNCLPGIRWVPHDIPETESSERARRSRFRRKSLRPKGKDKTENDADGPILPVHRRKSTISITSTPDTELDARTCPQSQSLFFSMLPIEVRKIVYEYVMGAETVHLTLGAKRRFGHFICEQGMGVDEDDEGVDCECRVLVGGKDSRKLDGTLVGALRVCRRMYSEAVPHLYNPHTFSLLHITHLLYLPTRFPTPRLNNVRTLRLRWAIRALPYLRRPQNKNYAYPEDTLNWQRSWQILADMKSLRGLHVVLVDPSPLDLWERAWLELEERLLEDIGRVKQVRWFEVVLPYASCDVGKRLEGCQVKFRKPDGEEVGENRDED